MEQGDAVWGSEALDGMRLEQVDHGMGNEKLGSQVRERELQVVL